MSSNYIEKNNIFNKKLIFFILILLFCFIFFYQFYFDIIKFYGKHFLIVGENEKNLSFTFYRDFRKNFRLDFTLDTSCTLPYLSASCLMLLSDFIYDDVVKNVEPLERLKDGDVIFIRTLLINEFFERLFHKIKNKIIIITHYSDYSTDKNHIRYLNDEKIIVWFGQNPGFEHPKFIPIPIGFTGTVWDKGKSIKYIRNVDFKNLIPWNDRKNLIYINFEAETNLKARYYLQSYFKKFNGVKISEKRIQFNSYMDNIQDSKYVLCPRGNGLDTHRFYETVLMGSIPIVENSTLFPIFKKTTTLIVSDFKQVSMHMLENPHLYISDMNFSKGILFFSYWVEKIDYYKLKYLSKVGRQTSKLPKS